MPPYFAFIGIICCCLVGLVALFGIILFIPFCCLIVWIIVSKLYRRFYPMPEYYFLIVYKAYKLKSDETEESEIVRVLTESEFEAFDTSKVCVIYQLRSSLSQIKIEMEKFGWKQTNYQVIKMSLDQFTKIYLDYFNNFATVKAFADHYGITEDEARKIITLGNNVYNLNIDFGHTNR